MEIQRIGPSLGSLPKSTQLGIASGPTGNFQNVLSDAVQQLNELQQKADNAIESLASGEPIDLHDVTIAMEEASLGFQLALQVRNKLIEAYQEVMRMQV